MKRILFVLMAICCLSVRASVPEIIAPDVKIVSNDLLPRSNVYFPMYKAISDAFYANYLYTGTSAEEGQVVVLYSVYKRGRVTQAKIVKGLSKEIDEEVLRVIKLVAQNLKFSADFRNNNYIQSFYISPSKEKRTVFVEDEPIYAYETMPSGMVDNMLRYIQTNLKYPPRALEEKSSGRVMTSFVLDENGDVKCGVVEGAQRVDLDREALRVVANMPQFPPYVNNDKPVSTYFTLPVIFSLK